MYNKTKMTGSKVGKKKCPKCGKTPCKCKK